MFSDALTFLDVAKSAPNSLNFVGVEDFQRRNFELIVISTPEQRQAWLAEVRQTVNRRFPAGK